MGRSRCRWSHPQTQILQDCRLPPKDQQRQAQLFPHLLQLPHGQVLSSKRPNTHATEGCLQRIDPSIARFFEHSDSLGLFFVVLETEAAPTVGEEGGNLAQDEGE